MRKCKRKTPNVASGAGGKELYTSSRRETYREITYKGDGNVKTSKQRTTGLLRGGGVGKQRTGKEKYGKEVSRSSKGTEVESPTGKRSRAWTPTSLGRNQNRADRQDKPSEKKNSQRT